VFRHFYLFALTGGSGMGWYVHLLVAIFGAGHKKVLLVHGAANLTLESSGRKMPALVFGVLQPACSVWLHNQDKPNV